MFEKNYCVHCILIRLTMNFWELIENSVDSLCIVGNISKYIETSFISEFPFMKASLGTSEINIWKFLNGSVLRLWKEASALFSNYVTLRPIKKIHTRSVTAGRGENSRVKKLNHSPSTHIPNSRKSILYFMCSLIENSHGSFKSLYLD